MFGKAGSSLQPTTVHFDITSTPNIASLASFTANVPTLDSVLSFWYRHKTSSTGISLDFCISHEGYEGWLDSLGGITNGPIEFEGGDCTGHCFGCCKNGVADI